MRLSSAAALNASVTNKQVHKQSYNYKRFELTDIDGSDLESVEHLALTDSFTEGVNGEENTANVALVGVLGSISVMAVLFCFLRQGYINHKDKKKQKHLENLQKMSTPKMFQHAFDKNSALLFWNQDSMKDMNFVKFKFDQTYVVDM